jgi:LmbE family N-acetylglucosaminyl deacetylase
VAETGSAGTGLILRKLDGVKRVLMIGAHPDDEDTSLLAALSRGMGVETAYLSLSRGEGGQNLLGEELGEGLGIVRTGELLAARSLDGGGQFFTRAFDFGYSKTIEETERYWPREKLLADVTWVVRTFRPHIIASVFSGTPRDRHGQHQMAGLMAQEVFDASGDPARFPEQLAMGAKLWEPQKLYRLTRFSPEEGTTSVETGVFDPLLGRSHFQLAMESRSQHRSQDMGTVRPMGPRESPMALVRSRVAEPEGDKGIFAGVDTTLLGLTEGLPVAEAQVVRGLLAEYRSSITRARENLDALRPWSVVPDLGRARRSIQEAHEAAGGLAVPELVEVLETRERLVADALLRASGVVTDARVEDDLLVPGEDAFAVVEVWNGGPLSLLGVRAHLRVPEGWEVRPVEGRDTDDLPPGALMRWRFRISVPADFEPSRLYYLAGPRHGATYRWPDDPTSWARPRDPPLVRAAVDLSIATTDASFAVTHERVATFRGVDKATGEFRKPVLIVPALSLAMSPSAMVWPEGMGGGREFQVRIRNEAAGGRSGSVRLEIPTGWNAEPARHAFDLTQPGAEASFQFRVTPPPSVQEGSYEVRAVASTYQGGPVEYSEGFALVDYPHIPRAALFNPSSARVSVFPVDVAQDLRVGYVTGSGDRGPEAIRQMGLSVELMDEAALRGGDFGRFDVIVLGIRAYETRPDLALANNGLLDFARSGGTLIVQYNKYEYPRGGFAPFPVEMNRPHDRVSDEGAPVTILTPGHPALEGPNVIGPEDFDGWVHERGLYFLAEWDARYEPLLEMADPGEPAKRGGLVVALLGEGVYVYTGLAFFRQFPEGVPGAYRLFANLLSLRGEDLGRWREAGHAGR